MRWLKIAMIGLSLGLWSGAELAQASDFDLGFSLGYGGAGITKTQDVNGAALSVKRSEGPGTFSLYMNYTINHRWTASLDHSRGFRLGPFTAGATFTGVTGRWYFKGSPTRVLRMSPESTTLFLRRYAFFVGPAVGVASGSINRPQDQVTQVSSSGVYIGLAFGGDVQMAPGMGLRVQIASNTTIASSVLSPASMQFFALSAGLLFML